MKTAKPILRSFRRAWPIAAVAALLGAGCASANATAKHPQDARHAEITDDDISTAVSNELMLDQAVPYNRVDVRVVNGIVRLSGTVNALTAKSRAQALAETVRGVRSVVNNIEVKPPRIISDRQLEQDVQNALFVDRATETYEIDAKVVGGVATLSGTVNSYAEARLAEKVARSVRGLRGVNNEINVTLDPNRENHEIEADVEHRLRWDALVDHDLIAVEVSGEGAVQLSGTVGSAAEKRRAVLDAWVTGVSEVNADDLEVESWAYDEKQRKRSFVPKDDSAIEKAVEQAMMLDPRANSFEIDADVDDGVVNLKGTVDNLQAKRAAEQVARSTTGVRRVRNYVKVQPHTPTDDVIEARVRDALARNAVTESYEITVEVEDRTAELSGVVDDYYEKAEADRVAASIYGVEEVDNDLSVEHDDEAWVYDPYVTPVYPHTYSWYDYQPGATTRTDAEIAEDIAEEMLWSPFVDANEVAVVVEDGTASLSGTVDSVQEMFAAVENAYEGGAIWVDNDLHVER